MAPVGSHSSGKKGQRDELEELDVCRPPGRPHVYESGRERIPFIARPDGEQNRSRVDEEPRSDTYALRWCVAVAQRMRAQSVPA